MKSVRVELLCTERLPTWKGQKSDLGMKSYTFVIAVLTFYSTSKQANICMQSERKI